MELKEKIAIVEKRLAAFERKERARSTRGWITAIATAIGVLVTAIGVIVATVSISGASSRHQEALDAKQESDAVSSYLRFIEFRATRQDLRNPLEVKSGEEFLEVKSGEEFNVAVYALTTAEAIYFRTMGDDSWEQTVLGLVDMHNKLWVEQIPCRQYAQKFREFVKKRGKVLNCISF